MNFSSILREVAKSSMCINAYISRFKKHLDSWGIVGLNVYHNVANMD